MPAIDAGYSQEIKVNLALTLLPWRPNGNAIAFGWGVLAVRQINILRDKRTSRN